MKVRLLRDVNIPGGSFSAGDVIETEGWIADRLFAKGHASPVETVEHSDPAPENRDPAPMTREPEPKRRKK